MIERGEALRGREDDAGRRCMQTVHSFESPIFTSHVCLVVVSFEFRRQCNFALMTSLEITAFSGLFLGRRA